MSIAKVAEKAGVSQATVSYVLNNRPGVSAETARRVRKVIKELGYVPRASHTRQTRPTAARGTTRSIGLLIPEESMSQSPLNMKLYEAIHQESERRGLRLVSARWERPARFRDLVARNPWFSEIAGMVFFYRRSAEVLDVPPPFPCVSVLGHADPLEPLGCDHVEPDHARIGAMAARYLAERGHRRLVVIKPSTTVHPAMDLRQDAFLAAAAAYGAEAHAEHIPIELGWPMVPGDLSAGHPLLDWIHRWRADKQPPDGIFVPSDSHLIIVVNAMARSGIDLASGVDFIGCNNESVLLRGLSPAPATVDINPGRMADIALGLLQQRIEEGACSRRSNCTVYVEPLLVPASI